MEVSLQCNVQALAQKRKRASLSITDCINAFLQLESLLGNTKPIYAQVTLTDRDRRCAACGAVDG